MRNISGETVIFITLIVCGVLFFGTSIFMAVKSNEEKFRVCIENGNQYIEGSCIPIPKDF